MAFLKPNEPLPLDPVEGEKIKVEGTAPDKPLPRGIYRFRLVVQDDAGVESDPFELDVAVLDKPIANFKPERTPIANRPFVLDGSSSNDPDGGRIVRYIWTFLGRASDNPNPNG